MMSLLIVLALFAVTDFSDEGKKVLKDWNLIVDAEGEVIRSPLNLEKFFFVVKSWLASVNNYYFFELYMITDPG